MKEDDDSIDPNSLIQKKSEGFLTEKYKDYLKLRKGKDFKLKTSAEKQFLFSYGFFYGAYYGICFGLFFALYLKYRFRMKIGPKIYFIFPLIFSSIFSITFGVYSAFLFDKDKILEENKQK